MIREGSLGQARQILVDLNLQKIPREEAAAFADIGRRLNMPKFMLQVLRPVIRPEIPVIPPATARELGLYATALSRVGSFKEAEKILSGLDGRGSPEILLYQAQNQMLQWNYTKPILPLSRYVRAKGISDYERLVGRVNLAASHVWNMKWESGEQVLAEIQREVLKKPDLESHKLIHGYSFELMAEMAILKGELTAAEIWIVKARELLAGSRSRYEFFVKKWQAILDLLKAPSAPEPLDVLRHVRREALQLKDWETRRDCDFYEALATRNDELYWKVYFGTPYLSYRKRIAQIYQPTAEVPEDYLWTVDGDVAGEAEKADQNGSPVRVFNMRTAGEEGGEALLTSKPLLYKLLETLSRDFFRPLPLGSLISELYPDEYFNPVTSPQKAYQAVVRLRDWFRESDIPLDVVVDGESYQLKGLGDSYAIRLGDVIAKVVPIKNISEMEQLRVAFRDRPFTTNEVARELGIAPRSAQRFLEKALADRKIKKTASGRSTRYKFIEKK